MIIGRAEWTDLKTILVLQREAYQSEAILYEDYDIQPLIQTEEELEQEYAEGILLKAVAGGQLVGSVRGRLQDGTLSIGKLIVAPSHQNQGIGTKLMEAIEGWSPEARRFELFTGHKSAKNLALYARLGYATFKQIIINDNLILIYLSKNAS
ncbi:GNAT family N-acetyltransferase [Paenibacillus paeoniae]|uniref:GNAT family N-acetyltransferase n=1 Tax=Paenibacillus paeoniae TaxID=2292705 RepID=UPI001F0C4E76|nr:GNAT family N-acetyltransferase [Paenibacillus paeoniae]